MYSPQIEELINAILADGVITEKERNVLHKRAMAEGIDPDEIDVIVDGRLFEMNKSKNQGAPVNVPPPPPQPAVQRSSTKYGVLHKCPNCGCTVAAASVRCDECGYTFREVGTVSSRIRLCEMIEEVENKEYKSSGLFGLLLSNLLEDEKRDQARASVIDNFPVPIAKDDLLEFILYLKPQTKRGFFDSDGQQFTAKAYKRKYNECLDKARVFFSDDPQFRILLNSK